MSTFIKRYWMQIQAQLEQLNTSSKWLIATLLTLGLVLVGIFVFLASSSDMAPISGFAEGRTEQIIARLQSADIKVRERDGTLMVPSDKRARAIAVLVQDDLYREDASAAFATLVENSSPWQTDAQGQRAYLVAKQRFLSQVLEKMKGIDTASVVLSYPQDNGFGRNFDRPSASVTVQLRGGRLDNHRVEAIAGLVSGAIAEMTPEDVVVVDATNGRRHMVTDPEDVAPGDRYELIAMLERNYEGKLADALAYIPKVIIAVNVRADATRQESVENWEYDRNQPLESERTREESSRKVERGGEPGVRPNTGLSIEGGQGGGTTQELSETETEFMTPSLVKRAQRTLVGQVVQSVNVSINVPRGFFVNIWKARNPDADAEPSDADLQPIMAEQLAQIEQQVEPLIRAEQESQLRVAMYPDETLRPMTAGGGLGSIEGVMNSDWLRPAIVLLLGLISVALMLAMVKKATTREELPSVEELAGLPPNLPSEEELVGEAGEHESSMAGMEVDEEELASRRIADQIGELIKANPDEAGALLGRWVRTDE